jgi:hypothetical protein
MPQLIHPQNIRVHIRLNTSIISSDCAPEIAQPVPNNKFGASCFPHHGLQDFLSSPIPYDNYCAH